MLAGEFKIDKDFIKLQIPSNLRDTWTFERVVDIFYATISEIPSGAKIAQYYADLEYYTTDFTKLSTEMKLQKLSDNGYSYLLDIFGDDDETLNNLSVFLVLIKILKGRYEGFKLILDALNFNYKFQTWDNLPATWDKTKFKFLGSPTVTDSGNYSCFTSTSNYISTVSSFAFTNDSLFEIKALVDLRTNTGKGWLYRNGFNADNLCIWTDSVAKVLSFHFGQIEILTETIDYNSIYAITFSRISTDTYNILIYDTISGVMVTDETVTIAETPNLTTNYLNIQFGYTSVATTGECLLDLSKFSIVIDDKEVFNGSAQPKGEIFTATITLTLTAEQAQIATSIIDKLQKIAWDYLAPSVNIEYTVVEELLSEDAIFNSYFSSGYVRHQNYPQFEISRSL